MSSNEVLSGDAVALPHSDLRDGEELMSIDLPPSLAGQLLAETAGNIQIANARQRDAAVTASNVLNAYSAQAFGEVGTLEGRAVSGVNNTPLGSPSGQ